MAPRTVTRMKAADAIAPSSRRRRRRTLLGSMLRRRRAVVIRGEVIPVDGRPLSAEQLRRLGQCVSRRGGTQRPGEPLSMSTTLAASARVDLPDDIRRALTAAAFDGATATDVEMPEGEIPWTSPALMFVDTPTGDGRDFAAAGNTHRDLPLSMMANLDVTEYGHVGALLSGRILTIALGNPAVPGDGVFADTDYGRLVAYHVWAGNLRGISVDLAISAYELEWIEDDEGFVIDYLFHSLEQAIMGATWTPHPAFADAWGEVPAGTVAEPETEGDDDAEVVLAGGQPRRRTVMAAAGGYALFEPEAPASGDDGDAGPAATRPAAVPLVAAGRAVRRAPLEWLMPQDLDPDGQPLIAEDPDPQADDLMRVYAHFGVFPEAAERLGIDACHVGNPNACVCTPHSSLSYARVQTGYHLTREGEQVAIGAVTLSGGHAADDGRASDEDIARQYDDTDRQSLHVAFYEDSFGPYVTGYVRPEMTDDQVLTIRASSLSGHWREYPRRSGNLEVLRVCHVNTPGFTVVRASAAGEPGWVLDDLGDPQATLEGDHVVELVASAGAAYLARRKADLLELAELATQPLTALDALRLGQDIAGLRRTVEDLGRRTAHVEPQAVEAALARIEGDPLEVARRRARSA